MGCGMTQYISTIIADTVDVSDLDPSVVVTASGSIITADYGIAGGIDITGASVSVDGTVYAGNTAI